MTCLPARMAGPFIWIGSSGNLYLYLLTSVIMKTCYRAAVADIPATCENTEHCVRVIRDSAWTPSQDSFATVVLDPRYSDSRCILSWRYPLTSIFPWWEITWRTMRMVFIVMLDRHCKVMQCRFYIRFRHERDVVFLHRFHEPFCHSITLRATDCRCAGLQIQLSGELPCFMRSVRLTVICQPLDGLFRYFIAKAFFYRS